MFGILNWGRGLLFPLFSSLSIEVHLRQICSSFGTVHRAPTDLWITLPGVFLYFNPIPTGSWILNCSRSRLPDFKHRILKRHLIWYNEIKVFFFMMFIQEEEEVFLQHNPQIPDIVTDRLATDTQVPTNTYRVLIKYCVFFKEFSKVCPLPSPALGCYWLYKKLPVNRSDCTLALCWGIWRSLTAM